MRERNAARNLALLRRIALNLARFRRRSKVTSRARHMVDGALKLLCHLRQPENFLPTRDSFLSIFG